MMYTGLMKSLSAKAESLLALADRADEDGIDAWWERTKEETLFGSSSAESKTMSDSISTNSGPNFKRLSCFEKIMEEADEEEEVADSPKKSEPVAQPLPMEFAKKTISKRASRKHGGRRLVRLETQSMAVAAF